MKKTWIMDPKTGKLIPEEEYYASKDTSPGLTIIPDESAGHSEHLHPTKTVSWTGRRSKRELMKQAGVIEWEPGLNKKKPRQPVHDPMVNVELRNRRNPKETRRALEKQWRDYHRG